MTERGLPVDGAPACPFVAFEHDRDARATSPDHRHRCFAEPRPAPRALAHQEAYCLSSAFPVCPTFQDWARREAASATGGGIGAGTDSDRRSPASVGGAGAGVGAAGASVGGAAAAAGAGAASGIGGGSSDRQSLLRATRDQAAQNPEWPSAPSWPAADLARRHAARTESPPPDDEDLDDSAAPRFIGGRTEPGRGLAGSPADRFARSAEPSGARPAWPTSDDGTPGRNGPQDDDRAGRAAAFGAGAAIGAASGVASRPASAAPSESGYARDLDDPFYGDRDRAPRDYGEYGRSDARADVVDRPAREEPKRRGLFNRDTRPKVGDTRREPEEPAWEQPRRYDTYPTLKARRSLPISRLLVAVLALVAAAVGFFLLPGFLGVGSPVTPSGSASVAPSQTTVADSAVPSASVSLAPTPVPTPTPLTYTIKRGDTLTRVANRFKVTLDQLMAANPQIKNPNQVNIGDVIFIPTGAALTTPTP